MKALLTQANLCILILLAITCTFTNADDIREEIIEYEDTAPQREYVENVHKKSKNQNIGVGNENTGESEVNIGHGHSSEKGWSILNTKVLSKPKVELNRAGVVLGKGANQPDRDIDISMDGEKKAIKM